MKKLNIKMENYKLKFKNKDKNKNQQITRITQIFLLFFGFKGVFNFTF